MNTMSILLCVVVTLFYSTTTVNGNCPDDESSTLPSSISVLDDRRTTILPSSSVKDNTMSPSSSPTPKDITRSSSPSPSPSPLTSPLNEECPLPHNCKDWYDLGIRKTCVYPIYPDGKTQQMVYCDMKGTHCDGKGGWTRVAYLNMTESGATCPTGLTKRQYNNIDHGVCGRTNSSGASCVSTMFLTLGVSYNKVCGQVRGYQYASPDAFEYRNNANIDTPYVDGVSITHGQDPHIHIWTYAGGWREDAVSFGCPCNSGYPKIKITSTLAEHYYCESGLDPGKSWEYVLYANDTLWDGKNCDSLEASCCTNSKMPWFFRVFDDKTQDDIELRVCGDEVIGNEDIPLDIIELYVQ